MRIAPYLALTLAPPLLAPPALAQQFSDEQVISFRGGQGEDVAAADLDGDGYPEPIKTDAHSGEVFATPNLGGGAFGNPLVIGSPGAGMVGAADLDGDGLIDVFCSTSATIIWYPNLGSGSFGQARIVEPGFGYSTSVYACDIDLDSDVDLVASLHNAGNGTNELRWYENTGGGVFGLPATITTGSRNQYRQIFPADLDQDGDLDLVAAGIASQLVWIENAGGGTFATERLILDPADNVLCLRSADVDGDFDADVVFYAEQAKALQWIETIGPGTFGAVKTIATTAQRTARLEFEVADLDGDGDMDLAVADYFLDEVYWHKNRGNASFGSKEVISTSAKWVTCIASSDLDLDGDVDLVSTRGSDGNLVWYENLSADADVDDDGLRDIDEINLHGTDPARFDSDGDGLGDGQELGVVIGTPDTDPGVFVPDAGPWTTTNPLLADTDQAGVDDGIEDQNQDGRVDTWETDPNWPGDDSPAFYVSGMSPGSQINFEVHSALPDAVIRPAYSLNGPGPTSLGVGVIVNLTHPISELQSVVADSNGRASWLGPRLGPSVPWGLPVWMQALEIDAITGALRTTNAIAISIGAN